MDRRVTSASGVRADSRDRLRRVDADRPELGGPVDSGEPAIARPPRIAGVHAVRVPSLPAGLQDRALRDLRLVVAVRREQIHLEGSDRLSVRDVPFLREADDPIAVEHDRPARGPGPALVVPDDRAVRVMAPSRRELIGVIEEAIGAAAESGEHPPPAVSAENGRIDDVRPRDERRDVLPVVREVRRLVKRDTALRGRLRDHVVVPLVLEHAREGVMGPVVEHDAVVGPGEPIDAGREADLPAGGIRRVGLEEHVPDPVLIEEKRIGHQAGVGVGHIRRGKDGVAACCRLKLERLTGDRRPIRDEERALAVRGRARIGLKAKSRKSPTDEEQARRASPSNGSDRLTAHPITP